MTAEMRSQLDAEGVVMVSVSTVGDPAAESGESQSANVLPSITQQMAVWAGDPGIEVVASVEGAGAAELVVSSQEALDDLAADPRIASIVIPPYQATFAAPGDGLRGAQRETAIEASQMHAQGLRGGTARVALIDTGVDATHVDLAGSVVYEYCVQVFSPTSCANGTAEQTGPGAAADVDGHGTAMASLIASAGTATPQGVAPESRLEVIRISDRTSLDLRDVLLALDHIATERPDVHIVVLSLGSLARFSTVCERDLWPAFHDTVAALRSRGTFLTASTGNNGDSRAQQFPACLADVHAVAGLDVAGTGLALSSNVALSTDLAAPGSGLAVHEDPISFGGTSNANAIVAGCAALAVDSGRVDPDAVAQWLRSPDDLIATPFGFATPRLQCAPHCLGAAVTVNLALGEEATDGDDVISGTAEADLIYARKGNDLVCAGAGDDVVYAGQGDDLVAGEHGADRLWGNFGDDVLRGGDGDDTLHGNAGDDELYGESGADRIYGYSGADVVSGGQGDDRLHGNRGDDRIDGDSGDDLAFGYSGNDRIDGGIGTDRCRGNDGNDATLRCEP